MNLLSNAIDAIESRWDALASRYANANDAFESSQEPTTDNEQAITPSITIRTEMVTNTGEVTPSIDPQARNRVRICIADNGSGIPEVIKRRIFDPFFTTKSVGEGTGLGLSISHTIVVEKHGGSLQCVSKPGQGTQFWIEIPIID
jgi:signal transduction histidine kinase